jgi:REP element-mobilizing transposase RayT
MKHAKTLFNPKGAGRPTLSEHKRKQVAHRKRPLLPKNTPVHVTIKIRPFLFQTLRRKIYFKKISRAISRARNKGLRIIHFTVQKDHLHFMIETKDNLQLAKGMQSLGISLSKSLKVHVGKHIKSIYKSRYHLHILNTIKEIKNAKYYILGNSIKHGVINNSFDSYSSVLKAPELIWKFDFEKYFHDLLHFLDYEELIFKLIDDPLFYKTKLALSVGKS